MNTEADTASQAPAPTPGSTPEQPRKKSKLPRILIAVLILVLAGAVAALAMDRSEKSDEIADLTASNAALENQVEDLEGQVAKTERQNEKLETNVAGLETEVADLEERITDRSDASIRFVKYTVDELVADGDFTIQEMCTARDAASSEEEFISEWEAAFKLSLAQEGAPGALSARDFYDEIMSRC